MNGESCVRGTWERLGNRASVDCVDCVRPSTRRVAIRASDRESGSTCRRQEKRRCRRRVLALTFSPLSCQSAVPPSEKEWQRRE